MQFKMNTRPKHTSFEDLLVKLVSEEFTPILQLIWVEYWLLSKKMIVVMLQFYDRVLNIEGKMTDAKL